MLILLCKCNIYCYIVSEKVIICEINFNTHILFVKIAVLMHIYDYDWLKFSIKMCLVLSPSVFTWDPYYLGLL